MLKRIVIALSLVLAYASTAPATAGGCGGCKGCSKAAQSGHGPCCGKGKAFGVALASQKLYDALAGQDVSASDVENCSCPNCKTAASCQGCCDQCMFAGGKKYASQVAYRLAKGKPMPAELVAACPKRCDECKTAHAKNGKCKKCGVGFVADRMFENDSDYQAALAALQLIEKAAKTAKHCEQCAVAMVTDGRCDKCNVSYKNGRMASAGH